VKRRRRAADFAEFSGGGRRSGEATAAVGCGGDFISASEWRSTAEGIEDGAAGGGGEQRRSEAAEEGAPSSSKREERTTIVSAQRRRQTAKKTQLRRSTEPSHLQTVWIRRLSASQRPSSGHSPQREQSPFQSDRVAGERHRQKTISHVCSTRAICDESL
jgi:hypothetical protein